MNERIIIEDALKHIYKVTFSGRMATVNSLAGALSVSGERAVEVIEELRASGLLLDEAAGYQLTEQGQHYALQVIRAHRLYERFLADATGVAEDHWHQLAEIEEHRLSGDQLAEMESRLGYPRFDPHGDPIPSREGQMPRLDVQPLLACPESWHGRILHIEDEPPGVFAGISKLGLAAGMQIQVEEVGQDLIRLRAEGTGVDLPRSYAQNIAVEAHPSPARPDPAMRRLTQLELGEQGEVLGLTAACRGAERNRLLDLGLVPGTKIEIDFSSASGNPVAYRIRGACIALRNEQAEYILIRPLDTHKVAS